MEKLKLKQRAVQFYNKNQVPQSLEKLLNTMFLKEPSDVYGYMSEYFAKLANTPSISKIECERSLSATGYPTLSSTISCCVNGINKEICSLDFFKDLQPVASTKGTPINQRHSAKKKDTKGAGKSTGGTAKKDHLVSEDTNNDGALDVPKYLYDIDHVIDLIEHTFTQQLIGSELQRTKVDEILRRCSEELIEKTSAVSDKRNDVSDNNQSDSQIENEDRNNVEIKINSDVNVPEESNNMSNMSQQIAEIQMTSLFLSLLVSMACCEIEKLPLCKVLNDEETQRPGNIPIPAVCFVSCDQTTSGKVCMLKEVLVLPKPRTYIKEGIENVVKLFHSFEKEMNAKFGGNGAIMNGKGILTPSFDKVEQVFEMLSQSAKNEFHCELNEMFDLIINIGAHSLYDEEKKKYDVIIGASKTTEDLIQLYTSWLDIYPIVGLVDPVSDKDESGVTLACEELSSRCYLINSQYKNTDELRHVIDVHIVDGALLDPVKISPTLTDIKLNLKFLEDTTSSLITTDEWSIYQEKETSLDLSLFLNSLFLRILSPANYGAKTLRKYLRLHKDMRCNEGEEGLRFKDSGYVFRSKPKEEIVENVEENEMRQDDSLEIEGER